MNKNKKIYFKCPKCRKVYKGKVPTEDVPIRTKKDKDGQLIVLSKRSVPICTECGQHLERRTEKIERLRKTEILNL